MVVASMVTVRMSQMWMLRWVVLLAGLQLIQADFMIDYELMGFPMGTMWPTTTAKTVRASDHVNNICSMWGNFHFKTFDGDFYQFPGTCEYNLVSDCKDPISLFSIYVNRTGQTKTPKISRVLVTINGITFNLTKSQVMINGENKSLPLHEAGILVEENTIYIRLYYKMGITVIWNKEDAVTVELDSKYSNRTCGGVGWRFQWRSIRRLIPVRVSRPLTNNYHKAYYNNQGIYHIIYLNNNRDIPHHLTISYHKACLYNNRIYPSPTPSTTTKAYYDNRIPRGITLHPQSYPQSLLQQQNLPLTIKKLPQSLLQP
ncbi:mucin-5AC-like [Cyprinus carpio]|uniref:Mucin-5AC-like n=1 Tax=Cyprinus carpio TaxID=7962 RepID=A0A9Q9VVA9_CYPCA|nr:mucin-5AC-like [Cyprinus carpio]